MDSVGLKRFLKESIKVTQKVLVAIIFCSSVTLYALPLTISQIPLIMASPIHPQVLILIGNSQSMDGTLSGAIMTGSGSLAAGLTSLYNSSSPVNYAVPSGFTPPLQGPDGSGNAPYTVTSGGVKYDNGPSRLNVAKAGVTAILNSYMATTDFGLATYSTSGVNVYNTWVYHMSPTASNFVFTNTQVAGNRYVINPCYNYGSASATILSNCTALAGRYGAATLSDNQYMQIGSTSDDPSINDVLYASGAFPGAFNNYNGPTPATPYPPNRTLAQYNSGSVTLSYANTLPNIGGFAVGPTNAGFVPFSQEVFYVQRGFGYYGSQSASTGTIRVNMTSAGTYPTTASVATALSAFTPLLQPETNSTATSEIKASAVQAPMAGLLSKAKEYMSTLGTTSGNGCPQKKYVILISDGLPTQDLSGKKWPPLGSAAAAGYGVTATFNADGSLNSTNNTAVSDAISKITELKNSGVNVYIIGLGAGVNPSLNPQAAATLTAMAVAGGTENYYPATDPTSLANSLNSILISIQNGSFTTSAAAVSSTRIDSSTVEYQANFVSSDTPYRDWTGNLFAIELDPNTGAPTNTTLWNAQSLLDTLVAGTGWSTNRLVATWNPTASAGVPFRWANISAAQQALLQSLDTLGSKRVEYIRGSAELEKRNGGTFRNRSHYLGDIVDSQVIFVGAPKEPYSTTSYIAFAKANVDRQEMIYVGANDGMLHAINAATGSEVFAFIPNAVFNNLEKITAPLYNQNHLFYVNGSPTSGDVQFSNASWHTLVVGGQNAGGSSIYALDVTDPASINNEASLASSVLWEFTDIDLGLTYSQPQIGIIKSASTTQLSFAVFFGNGYNSSSNKSILYAVDPQTGTVIRKIDLCAAVPTACDAASPQGLSTVALAQSDGIQNSPITVVYAGDLQGNLWAIDVDNVNAANWTARVLFQARDSSGVAQPITTPPTVTLNPNYPRNQGLLIMFGTGQLLTSTDLLSTQTQSIYGIWDKPGINTTLARTDLQQQTLTLVTAATSGLPIDIITSTANTINWNNKYGWYTDFPTAGQRLITIPALINGKFIATINTPPLDACGIAFSSMLLEINYQTGGSFNFALFDLSGDGGFDSDDQYNNAYPVGIDLSNHYANSPTVLGPNESGHIVILITQSDGAQTTVINPNTTPRKVGWWQIE
jgi:type IV pilus assembly protein PilY1